MKKYIPIVLLGLIFSWVFSNRVSAQDPHLSQAYASPVLFNPANTGMLNFTDMRITALYRSQWSSLATSFNTFVMSFDMAATDRWGFGGVFVNTDEANIISSSNFLFSAAYQVNDPNQTKYRLTTGAQLGLLYKRINTNGMIFNSQFDGRNFDSDIASGENFDRSTRFMIDANIGISFKSTDRTKRINPYADFAIFHATTPNESFIGEEKSKLPMRFMGNLGARIEVNRDFLIDPSVTWMRQRESQQFLIHAMAHYSIAGTPYQVLGGLGYRTADAAIITAGIRHNANIFSISYDINTSKLSEYSKNRGALEFSVIYRPGRRSSRAIY